MRKVLLIAIPLLAIGIAVYFLYIKPSMDSNKEEKYVKNVGNLISVPFNISDLTSVTTTTGTVAAQSK
jgi:hypothetical protein